MFLFRKIISLLIIFLALTSLFTSCNFNSPFSAIENNGDTLRDITMPDTSGKLLSLSSMRGKYVLVDFWASWCVPCREQDAQLVKLYSDFHAKHFRDASGFRVYSISFDADRSRWIGAIRDDSLIWADHVSRLTGWDSSVVEDFGVSAIPANFLIDPKGKILGMNLSLVTVNTILTHRLR